MFITVLICFLLKRIKNQKFAWPLTEKIPKKFVVNTVPFWASLSAFSVLAIHIFTDRTSILLII